MCQQDFNQSFPPNFSKHPTHYFFPTQNWNGKLILLLCINDSLVAFGDGDADGGHHDGADDDDKGEGDNVDGGDHDDTDDDNEGDFRRQTIALSQTRLKYRRRSKEVKT